MPVGLLNELHGAIVHHRGSRAAREVSNRLAEYKRTHLTVEEALMRILNYPESARHKEVHEDLPHQVIALQQKLDSGQAAITFLLLRYRKGWLTEHSSESDKRFGAFAVAKGLAPSWSPQVADTMANKKWRWKFW